MPDYVFSFGLIPVQEWISEARRSRDLRVGSVLLGYLTAKVLARLLSVPGSEILVPSRSDDLERLLRAESLREALDREVYGIPNRASGYVSAVDEGALRELFRGLEPGIILAEWARLKTTYLGGLDQQILSIDSSAFRAALWRHLPEYLEAAKGGRDCPFSLVWVAEAVADRSDGEGRDDRVQRDLLRVDELFTFLKKSRPVRAWGLGAQVGKCTQCGRREAYGPREAEGGKSLFATWRAWHQDLVDADAKGDRWLQRGFLLDASERLCYVCLLKRLAAYDVRRSVRSTGEVAAARWIERVRGMDEPAGEAGASPASAYGVFLDAIKNARLDLGRALFLTPERLRTDFREDEVAGAKKALETAVAREGSLPSRPPPYLALLTFDGDDMGRRICGDPLRLPGVLSEFGRGARSLLLERHAAEIFYLAGDEGLAMVPAEEGLPAALALRQLFAERFEAEATLSAGLAFFEQARPMAGAIRAARAVLEEAKARPEKNALGVAVETASGSRWRFVEAWGSGWRRIAAIVRFVQEKHLSPSWAYDLEAFLESLSEEAWSRVAVRDAAREEARRLLARRILFPPGERLTPEEKRRRRQEMWRELEAESWWSAPEGSLPDRAPQQLHLVGFLARQMAVSVAASEGEG